jgi:hypothetical protein
MSHSPRAPRLLALFVLGCLVAGGAGWYGRHRASTVERASLVADVTERTTAPAAAASPTSAAPSAAPSTTVAVRKPPPATAPTPTPTGRTLASVGPTRALAQKVPDLRGALPVGKGMWIWQEERTEGGDVSRIVQRAVDVGLTHLYVRTGSSWQGFYAQAFLDRLLPVAHAAGVRVYGWDFPNLADWQVDADRALAAITYTTPTGHRIDGFAADIETGSEGTRLSPEAALAYGTYLRQGVGNDYPLIACVPRPSPRIAWYPYPHVVAQFDAIAPMVYWLNRTPDGDVAGAVDYLKQFGKPIMPVGQAYDGSGEGGRPGVPPRNELLSFMETAERHGAVGVSFWSWQAADQPAWDAIRDASQFVVYEHRANQTGGRNEMVQTLLTSLGFPTPVTGDWDGPTQTAMKAYQRAAGLGETGELDGDTRNRLLTPAPPPIRPLPR